MSVVTSERQSAEDDAAVHEQTTTKEKLAAEDACTLPILADDIRLDDFPDGGTRAWLVLFGTMCTTFSTFGFVNAWGVFQAYYETSILKDSTASDIAWIGSIQYSLVFLPGLITGRMFDLGYFRVPFLIASAVFVAAVFITAQCKVYWQFLLCQGFGIGLSSGVMFGPSIGVISHWFRKRRGFALGLMGVGSSLGGTFFPIVTRNLINQVGFPWTMRILGFILIATIGPANLTLRRRLPPVNIAGGLLNLAAFKSAAYTTYCLSTFTSFLGIYTVLTYIDISAVAAGLSPNFAFYLVAIANASSGVGRYAFGLIIDNFGAINLMAPLSVCAAVLTYAWPFATTEKSIIVIAVLYGFTSAAYVSSFTNPLVELGQTGDVGRRIGMAMTILAFGALAGPPISGAINTATGGFEAVGYYAGSMVLVSVVFMCICRQLVLRRLFGKF